MCSYSQAYVGCAEPYRHIEVNGTALTPGPPLHKEGRWTGVKAEEVYERRNPEWLAEMDQCSVGLVVRIPSIMLRRADQDRTVAWISCSAILVRSRIFRSVPARSAAEAGFDLSTARRRTPSSMARIYEKEC